MDGQYTVKQVIDFPVPILTVIIPRQGEFGKWHPGWDGKLVNLFLQSNLHFFTTLMEKHFYYIVYAHLVKNKLLTIFKYIQL